MDRGPFTVGVEEEFLVVDAATGALRPDGPALLPEARARLGDDVHPELHRSQLEINTPVASGLAEARRSVTDLRRALAEVVAERGYRIAASGTHPFSAWTEDPDVHPKYEVVEREYQQLAREQIICGVHVHVGIEDPEAAIAVLNGVIPWLSPIVALAANSPFWNGRDTGYASFRTELWRRWPTAGTPAPFTDRAEYDALVDMLFRTGSIDDYARLYWDVRPSAKFPTVEFRVADVGLTVDDTVMIAGLVRGLAATAAAGAGGPHAAVARSVRPEMIRAATWRAARYGVSGELLDVEAGEARPAREIVGRLLDVIRPALAALGDWDEVAALVEKVLTDGTGADRQRRVLAEAGTTTAVLEFIVEETSPAAW
ncbi:MAG TPA: glutamate--cysteine ligase [Acidimicrobiia bacterium]|nr:glutamate--cysteine ligase [Acidimicrobiia bacterium]